MKKEIFTFSLMLISVFVYSQDVIFHENFELPSLDDSVTSSQPSGIKDWNVNTNLYSEGFRSVSCEVDTAVSTSLTTDIFSALGGDSVVLTFSHICKVDFLDDAILQVTNDGGTTWHLLVNTHYLGVSNFSNNGNRFCSNSYGNLWFPANPDSIPDNTWWREESFDISQFAAHLNNVKVRFLLSDGGPPGSNGNYGWIIDNIRITQYYFTSIAENKELDINIMIYPNPTSNALIITSDKTDLDKVKIFNTNGRFLKEIQLQGRGSEKLIEFSEMGKGIYLLQLYYDNIHIASRKVIVE